MEIIMKYFFVKYRKLIFSILAWIFNSLGIALSIWGNIIDGPEKLIIMVNLIAAEIFFMCSVIYSLCAIIRDISRQELLEQAKIDLSKMQDANRKMIENNKSIITNYKDVDDTLNKIVADYQESITRIKTIREHTHGQNDEIINEYIEKESLKEYENFRHSLIRLYNNFHINILNCLKSSLSSYSAARGYKCSIAIATKQLTDPIEYSKIDERAPNIYTAFRDSQTYNNKLRNETWTKKFSIYENSDFSHSIAKDYCIFNNISRKSGMYRNENRAYYEYYNSGITYAIYSCIGGERKLYGFIACDSLLTDKEIEKNGAEMFDLNMANILSVGAHMIAVFLEKFLKVWESNYSPEYYEQNHKKSLYSKNFCEAMKYNVDKARYNG